MPIVKTLVIYSRAVILKPTARLLRTPTRPPAGVIVPPPKKFLNELTTNHELIEYINSNNESIEALLDIFPSETFYTIMDLKKYIDYLRILQRSSKQDIPEPKDTAAGVPKYIIEKSPTTPLPAYITEEMYAGLQAWTHVASTLPWIPPEKRDEYEQQLYESVSAVADEGWRNPALRVPSGQPIFRATRSADFPQSTINTIIQHRSSAGLHSTFIPRSPIGERPIIVFERLLSWTLLDLRLPEGRRQLGEEHSATLEPEVDILLIGKNPYDIGALMIESLSLKPREREVLVKSGTRAEITYQTTTHTPRMKFDQNRQYPARIVHVIELNFINSAK